VDALASDFEGEGAAEGAVTIIITIGDKKAFGVAVALASQ
jgi:hypothetical protein